MPPKKNLKKDSPLIPTANLDFVPFDSTAAKNTAITYSSSNQKENLESSFQTPFRVTPVPAPRTLRQSHGATQRPVPAPRTMKKKTPPKPAPRPSFSMMPMSGLASNKKPPVPAPRTKTSSKNNTKNPLMKIKFPSPPKTLPSPPHFPPPLGPPPK